MLNIGGVMVSALGSPQLFLQWVSTIQIQLVVLV